MRMFDLSYLVGYQNDINGHLMRMNMHNYQILWCLGDGFCMVKWPIHSWPRELIILRPVYGWTGVPHNKSQYPYQKEPHSKDQTKIQKIHPFAYGTIRNHQSRRIETQKTSREHLPNPFSPSFTLRFRSLGKFPPLPCTGPLGRPGRYPQYRCDLQLFEPLGGFLSHGATHIRFFLDVHRFS